MIDLGDGSRSLLFRATLLLIPLAWASADAAVVRSCRAEIGTVAAQRLVRSCLAVSPATHPPCNASNPCSFITDEIDRGCAMLGKDAPAACRRR